MKDSQTPEILVIQRRMTHYRLPFFESLRYEIEQKGGHLKVAYGVGTAEEELKKDGAELPWGTRLHTTYLLNGRLCWQPFSKQLKDTSLVVFASENKLIYNLYAQVRFPGRVALWGHGANLQGDPNSTREKFKKLTALGADWWFGYTEYSRPFIEATGFPKERVTILNNSVDTHELNATLRDVTFDQVADFQARQRLSTGRVGLYLGSLYSEKRIDFLIDAAKKLALQIPGFVLVIVGDGPLRETVRTAAHTNDCIRYLGSLKGQDKAVALRAASVILNPGLVGLGILDGFAAQIPLVTTDCGLHSPEIAYLQNGINGLMTDNNMDAFVSGVRLAMEDIGLRKRIQVGCDASNKAYTVQNMAARFASGCFECLGTDRRTWFPRRA